MCPGSSNFPLGPKQREDIKDKELERTPVSEAGSEEDRRGKKINLKRLR